MSRHSRSPFPKSTTSLLDIAPRTRLVLSLLAVIGVVGVIVASFDSGQAQSIGADKIIHFSGYMVLALVFSLVLRPLLLAPGLLSLVALGIGIEYLQPFFDRGFELADMVANGIGIATGALLGLTIRGVYTYLGKELASSRAKRNLRRFRAGERIMSQGDQPRSLYIIYQGSARLTREVDEKTVDFGVVGPGDAIGVLGLILGEPQYVTVTAEEDGILYSMKLDELIDSAGGPDQPVSTVMRVLANTLVSVGDRVMELENCPTNEAPVVPSSPG